MNSLATNEYIYGAGSYVQRNKFVQGCWMEREENWGTQNNNENDWMQAFKHVW